MNISTKTNLLKILNRLSILTFIGFWFVSGIINNRYVNLPRNESVAEGRIYPYFVKGIEVYINRTEKTISTLTLIIEIASGISSIGFGVLYNWTKNKS